MSSLLLESLLLRRQELSKEIQLLNGLIALYKGESPRDMPRLISLPAPTRTPRVRGVLAAARKAIDQLPQPFDKNQLLAKLIEIDKEFMHKKITGSNIRNALRLLTQDGVIKVAQEATATSRAKYVRAA